MSKAPCSERWTDLNATAIPIPANSSFRAWSFTHDLTLNGRTDLQSANVNIPTTAVTNANGAADTRLGSVSMGADDFVMINTLLLLILLLEQLQQLQLLYRQLK